MRSMFSTLTLALLLGACSAGKENPAAGGPADAPTTEAPAADDDNTASDDNTAGDDNAAGDDNTAGGDNTVSVEPTGGDVDAGTGGEVSTPGTVVDGGACLQASDCASGICEGEGCGDDTPGVCAPATRSCTRDLRSYCGCDGQTFRTSGSCPGRRFAFRGICEGDIKQMPVPTGG